MYVGAHTQSCACMHMHAMGGNIQLNMFYCEIYVQCTHNIVVLLIHRVTTRNGTDYDIMMFTKHIKV